MFTRIAADNYRSLSHTSQPLRPFQILVGPNGSGKSTFLDVLGFVQDVVNDGLEEAVDKRGRIFEFLLNDSHARQRLRFELDAVFPETHPSFMSSDHPDGRLSQNHTSGKQRQIRYELNVIASPETNEIRIGIESIGYLPRIGNPIHNPPQMSAMTDLAQKWAKHTGSFDWISYRMEEGDCILFMEQWPSRFTAGPGFYDTFPKSTESVFGELPGNSTYFPVATWFKELLRVGIHRLELDNRTLRNPSPAGKGKQLKEDGGNLPWVIEELKEKDSKRFGFWIEHLRTCFPDLQDISTTLRDEDRHRYLVLNFENGLKVPSWLVSDGTLRLIALTLIAYARDNEGIYLIEEPENGLHPQALQALYDSLSSVYGSQVLITTHSPVLLGLAKPEEILCFAKSESGTSIVSGDQHPALKNWHHEVSLSDLFAAGVLQ